eukprot:NODE_468_length_7060_cov_0.310157.p5 type:complete len:199 gc:universal NODE_468_length_7060_cov_0.310157:2961-3557(+)
MLIISHVVLANTLESAPIIDSAGNVIKGNPTFSLIDAETKQILPNADANAAAGFVKSDHAIGFWATGYIDFDDAKMQLSKLGEPCYPSKKDTTWLKPDIVYQNGTILVPGLVKSSIDAPSGTPIPKVDSSGNPIQLKPTDKAAAWFSAPQSGFDAKNPQFDDSGNILYARNNETHPSTSTSSSLVVQITTLVGFMVMQ